MHCIHILVLCINKGDTTGIQIQSNEVMCNVFIPSNLAS